MPREKTGFGKILVGVDGSEHSLKALRVACVLAGKLASRLVVVNVFSFPDYAVAGSYAPVFDFKPVEEDLQKKAGELVAQAVGIARTEAVEASGETLRATSPADAMTRYALVNDVDLIVVGTRGLTRFRRLVVGSVSGEVVAHAHCPVLIVK